MDYPTMMFKSSDHLILFYQMTEINFTSIGKLVNTHYMNFK